MRKFVWKIAGYLAVVALITLGVNFIYIKKDSQSNKFMNVPDGVQICNFGSSHGMYGYNYEDIEGAYTCFNFALDSQSLSYDYRILDTYKNKIFSGGAVVFIDISYFSPYGIPETEYDSFEAKNQRYYAFLPANKIKNYNLKNEVLSGKLRSLSAGPLTIASKLLRPVPDYINEDYWLRTADMIDVQADAKAAYHRHCVDGKLNDEGQLIDNKEETTALYDMINTCREIGATPVLVITPYLSEYIDAISEGSPGFLENFYAWLRYVAEEMDVTYYDYSRDKRFCDRYDLFINADHLNREGARKFTDILIEETVKKYSYVFCGVKIY